MTPARPPLDRRASPATGVVLDDPLPDLRAHADPVALSFPVPCRRESPMPLPTASAPRPPRRRESQLEEALARLTETRRAASRCPMCLRAHTTKPTGCLALAERRHSALCAHLLAAHAEGCRLVVTQQYVATLAD